jgi:hypothetical protein
MAKRGATRATPPPEPPKPKFDAARLIAAIREGAPNRGELLAQAHSVVFGSEMGRLVLLNFLAENGVGGIFGHEISDAQLRYQAGRHDAALELALAAGFDAVNVAAAVLTETLTQEPPYGAPFGHDVVASINDEF